MKTICFFNLKGGCGKTTSVLNLGWLLAEKMKKQGEKILYVDSDMQSNLTTSLLDYNLNRPSIYDIFMKNTPAEDVRVSVRDNIDLIPSSLAMATIEPMLDKRPNKQEILKNALEPLKSDYSHCLVDCSPSFSTVTINALLSADKVFIPVQTEYYAVDGVHLLKEMLAYINRVYGTNKDIDVIFTAIHDKRNNINRMQYQNLADIFPQEFMKNFIRKNVALVESPVFKESIFEYRGSSPGARDYKKLFQEIDSRGGF